MRHNKKFNHLGRTSAHRKAMLSNMASSLIESKRITTTVAKAKELRTYVEPLITKAKNDTTHSRRMVFKYLQNKNAVSELFREVAEKIGDRPGGYTRILRTGNRYGDNAEMCIIELVDYNESMIASAEETEKPKRRRSRRGGGAKKTDSAVREASQEMTNEEKTDTTEDAHSQADDDKVESQVEEQKSDDSSAGLNESQEEIKDAKATEDQKESNTSPKTESDEDTKSQENKDE